MSTNLVWSDVRWLSRANRLFQSMRRAYHTWWAEGTDDFCFQNKKETIGEDSVVPSIACSKLQSWNLYHGTHQRKEEEEEVRKWDDAFWPLHIACEPNSLCLESSGHSNFGGIIVWLRIRCRQRSSNFTITHTMPETKFVDKLSAIDCLWVVIGIY